MFGKNEKDVKKNSMFGKKEAADEKKIKKEKVSLADLAERYYPTGIDFEEYGICGESVVFHGLALGDIAGNRYTENEKHLRPTDELWDDEDLEYSGNSVLADAVIFAAKKLFMDGVEDKKMMKSLFGNVLKRAYRDNQGVFYEDDFARWASGQMREDESKRFQSQEDSAAVRAMCIGAMFDRVEDVIQFAMMSAMPTHAHPEGIKGAVVSAVCVFLLTHEASKSDVLRYAKRHYEGNEDEIGADVILSELEFGKAGKNSARCSYVVPAAIACFENALNYEETIRNALSIPGDAAAIAAIAGGLAAACYGETVPDEKVILKRYKVNEI